MPLNHMFQDKQMRMEKGWWCYQEKNFSTTSLGSYLEDIDKSNSGDVRTLPLEVFTILGSCLGEIDMGIIGNDHTLPHEIFTIVPNPFVLKVINIIPQEDIQMLSKSNKIFLR